MAELHSQLEKDIFNRGYNLSEITLPVTFRDKDNHKFSAKSDAVMLVNDQLTVIEFKDSSMNSKTSIDTCRKKLLAQCNWHQVNVDPTWSHNELSAALWKTDHRSDCIHYAWNHSRTKSELVCNGLAKYDINYLVVFMRHPATITYKKKDYYFQNFYKFKSCTFREFKNKYKTSDMLPLNLAKQLLADKVKPVPKPQDSMITTMNQDWY